MKDTLETTKTRRWDGYKKQELGMRHEKQGMKCQDYAEMERRGSRISMVLLDGRGDTDANADGVEEIAKTVNHFMLQYFTEIYGGDDRVTAYNLMLLVERKISELSEKYHVDYEEFASTLLAFCIDEDAEKYAAIHLGDGVIALKNHSDTIEILSIPANGISRNQTFSTTSENVLEHIRVYRGLADDRISGVVLASDGFYDKIGDLKNIQGCFSKTEDGVILRQKTDDQSVIALYV